MMIRPFTLFCALFAGVSGMVLYAQKHKTTQLDKEITKIVYDTQKIKARTAMLRTEWTLLNQPDRLKDLATNFIPGLRPLNPNQFVQMAAVTSVLPPIKQEPEKDKTRENLVKNVAQNNGQPVPFIVDSSSDQNIESKKTPAIIAQNTGNETQPKPQQPPKQTTVADNKIEPAPIQRKKTKTTEVANTTDIIEAQNPKPQSVKKPTVVTATNNVATDPSAVPARRKKVKTTEIAIATDAIEAQNLKPQSVKKPTVVTATNNVVTNPSAVPARRKKVKTTEIADATDAIEAQNLKPQTIKKNHIQNVSYNIQSDNPFSHSKTSRPKQTTSNQTSTMSDEAALEKKLSTKPKQQASTNTPKKRPAAIKVARNESKKPTYSESALGGNSDEALPAPVPFSH